MHRLYNFFVNSNNITKDSYFWNILSASLFAMQSAIVLMVITRTNGIEDAGIFSISYAIASLMYYIAEFGVRKYQVSDVHEECSFTDYHSHRIVTCSIATIGSILYVAYGFFILKYSVYKSIIVLIICMTKPVEAYSEVYFGRFQQVGRLDVSAKTNFYRIMMGISACIAVLAVTHNMIGAMAMWLVFSIIGVMTSSMAVYKQFGNLDRMFNWDKIKKISWECLPVFLGYFLLLYVSNAPKYAIDACMTDSDQACYNFIFMPVFAIGMFANFIFNPILVKLAHKWDRDEINDFTKILLRQILVIAGITLLAIAVALTIGCPVLGAIFNADLSEYRRELAILMVGGGMLALVNFYAVVVTVMRTQQLLTAGYVITAVVAGIMARSVVSVHGILGATILYTALMAGLSVIFAIITFMSVRRKAVNIAKNRHSDRICYYEKERRYK